MGTLRPDGADAAFHLPGRCLVGRSSACDLVLPGPHVSGHHAAIEWAEGAWRLQDLGSRNGSFVDERRVEPAAKVVLGAGARLRFGRDAAAWVLVDAGPPRALARDLRRGATRVAEGGYLALPDAGAPECAVYQRPDGAWVLERDGEPRAAEDRATITTADGTPWRLHLPDGLPGTLADGDGAALVGQLLLRFRVRRDEEQVELIAHCGAQRLDLKIRAHHYPLLLLARRRLADQARGVPEPEQGWIGLDELLQMLRLREPHFNIAVHRARTQLGSLGVLDAAALVERQPRMRRLRIGAPRLEIEALE